MYRINNMSVVITCHNIFIVCMFLFLILPKEFSAHFISFRRLPPFETLRPYFVSFGGVCFSQVLMYAILVLPMTGQLKYQEGESLLEVGRSCPKFCEQKNQGCGTQPYLISQTSKTKINRYSRPICLTLRLQYK